MICSDCPDKVTTKKVGRWGIKYNHRCGIDNGVIWHLDKVRKDCPLGLR